MKKIVILGGGGHVGLPLALALSNSGYLAVSLDVSKEVVELINSGTMPFAEEGAQELLSKSLSKNTFYASIDYREIINAEILIVVIGTPVDEHLNPDPNSVINALSACIPYMNSNQLVMLRSTVFPGVTNRIKQLLLQNKIYSDVTFCPERILEGHALTELHKLPQIIGANEGTAATRASKMFETLGVKTIIVSPEEAELAKLFTNAWRYIKFAAANQFWTLSNEAGLDYSKIRQAIIFDYPRALDLPNAGFTAGPCLFKDTAQLSAFANNNFGLGQSAMLVNEGLPLYIVGKMEKKYNLNDLRVGILGASFKAESDDIRSSLSYKLKRILEFKCKEVFMTDPYVTIDKDLVELERVLNECDILIIGAPHKVYKELVSNKTIIDIWNLLGKGSQI